MHFQGSVKNFCKLRHAAEIVGQMQMLIKKYGGFGLLLNTFVCLCGLVWVFLLMQYNCYFFPLPGAYSGNPNTTFSLFICENRGYLLLKKSLIWYFSSVFYFFSPKHSFALG